MRLLVRQTPDNFIRTVNDEISSILNKHFDDIYQTYENEADKMSMPLELLELKDSYEIRAELPGVKKEDLDIDLEEKYLTIRATKEEEKSEEDKGYKKSEFKYGEFSRSVYLPQDVDADKIKASLEHGVLKINVPKREKEKETIKKITIQ